MKKKSFVMPKNFRVNVLILLLAILVLVSVTGCTVAYAAVNIEDAEKTVYDINGDINNGKREENPAEIIGYIDPYYDEEIGCGFITDHVIIVLDSETSLRFENYTVEDFPEVDCISIHDLNGGLDTENYRAMLVLTLRNPGEENVLKAIEHLEKHEGVQYAGPDYLGFWAS